MSKRADDFPPTVVRTLGQRAAYICSNPDCRRLTAGPHSDPKKPLITGQAAHICAARSLGPRFNPNQNSESRKAITNGIWLCGGCNKKVDSDWKAWPAERLYEMKANHEAWIAAEGMLPALPVVALNTRSTCLLHPKFLPELNRNLQQQIREQELVIQNTNRVELFQFTLDVILPELPTRHWIVSAPIGPLIQFRPIRHLMSGIVSGGGSINLHAEQPTHQWNLAVNVLPADSKFRIAIYSVEPEESLAHPPGVPSMLFKDPALVHQHKECRFYLKGGYQFHLRGEYVPRELFAPLRYVANERSITSFPIQDTTEPWRIWEEFCSSGVTLATDGPGGAVFTSA